MVIDDVTAHINPKHLCIGMMRKYAMVIDDVTAHGHSSSKKTISAWKNHLITKTHDLIHRAIPRRHYK
jgi:hypothetical protein